MSWISPLLDALCFLLSKQWECEKIVKREWRDASQVPQRWIDQNSSEFSLRLNWPHWLGVIFPAGWARSVHYCAFSKGSSVRSEAAAPLAAAALTVSKPTSPAGLSVMSVDLHVLMRWEPMPTTQFGPIGLGKFLLTLRTYDLWWMGLERWPLGGMFGVIGASSAGWSSYCNTSCWCWLKWTFMH